MRNRNLISEFLSVKRFAMVGVSRKREKFSRRLFESLVDQGYDVIPVNPNASAIEGRSCFACVKDIKPQVTSALVLVPQKLTDQILLDCAEAGITLVWLYGIMGEKSIPHEALEICQKHGMEVIPGYCPFMFMPMTAFYHRLHGFAMKIVGKYPR